MGLPSFIAMITDYSLFESKTEFFFLLFSSPAEEA